MFPMAAALMHEALQQAARRFGDRDAVRSGDERWSFRDLDGLSNAFARHLAGRGVGAGDRVALMTANRLEFVVAVHAISKLGAAAVLLSPAWKLAEVRHALDLTGPVHARGRRRRRRRCSPTAWARTGVTDLDDPAADPFAHSRARTVAAAGCDGRRRGGPGLQLGDHRPPQGGPPHPRVDRPGHRPLGARSWASARTTGSRWPRPPSHILGLLNLLAAVSAGATVRLHRRFDLDEVLAGSPASG